MVRAIELMAGFDRNGAEGTLTFKFYMADNDQAETMILIATEIIVGTSGIGFLMFDARRAGSVVEILLGMALIGAGLVSVWFEIGRPLRALAGDGAQAQAVGVAAMDHHRADGSGVRAHDRTSEVRSDAAPLALGGEP